MQEKGNRGRKNYRFDEATIHAIENRNKELYPVEVDFIRDAIKRFSCEVKMEELEHRVKKLEEQMPEKRVDLSSLQI